MPHQLTLDGHMARAAHHPATPALPLRPYQRDAIEAVDQAELGGVTRSLIVLPTGCHRAGQELLMHDGSIQEVEDVRVGDRLMGPDGQPRVVLALMRGISPMMEIRPVKGASWFVNDKHVLTLVETREKGHGRYPSQRGGTVRDVALPDWWQWSKNRRHRHKLFRVAVDFPEREAPPLDPYFLGVVLGDGSLAIPGRVSVTNIDAEVIEYVGTVAASYGLHLRQERDAYHIVGPKGPQANPILDILRCLELSPVTCESRFIPGAYKLGSRETRRQVLAGLLDTDGSLSSGGYDYCSKSEALADGVAFIARSLGLAAYVSKRPLGHYRVSISGDCSVIPCRIPRKQAPPRAQKKDALRTGFQVIPTGTVEPHYGFTLSGDGRYLLDDFTVTHNSGKSVIAARQIVQRGCRALFIAHRDELLTQAADKLHQVAPSLEIGVVKAERDQVGADVVFASIQTLARPSRLARVLQAGDFGLVVVDEAHHCHIGGTLVETTAGPQSIETLQRGDAVLAWNGNAFVPRSVVRTYRHWHDGPIHEITTESGRSVRVTPNHRLYSRGERVHASRVGVGDHLSVRSVWLDNAEVGGHCDAHLLAPPGIQALPPVLDRLASTGPLLAPGSAPMGARHLLQLRSGICPLTDPAGAQRGGALRGDRVVAVRVRHHCGWVYDLEVTEHHNYLANGVLSSNSTAATYVAVLEALGGMRDDGTGPLVVGFTATPERGDRVGLGQVWQKIAYQRSILRMITDGYLVDARGLMVSTPADLASLRTAHGDLVDAEVGAELVRSGALGSIAEAYARNARDRKGVAFVPTVETAYALAEAMRAEGLRAEGIDGTTPPELRRAILGRLRSGETQVACNAMLLTEGWDEPSISCVLMARPTKSRPLYIQMAGRGLRIYPGKTDCLILDAGGATARLDLVTVADLAGLPKGEVEGRTITEAIAAREEREQAERAKGEALKVATATAATSLFRSKLRWIQAGATFVLPVDGGVIRLTPEATGETWRVERDLYKGRLVVAEALSLEYAQGVGEDQVRELGADHLARADAPWRDLPATSKQLDMLARWGVPVPEGATRGWASDQITPRLAAQPRRSGKGRRR